MPSSASIALIPIEVMRDSTAVAVRTTSQLVGTAILVTAVTVGSGS